MLQTYAVMAAESTAGPKESKVLREGKPHLQWKELWSQVGEVTP